MKVVFLDRDGVINEYPGDTNYVNNWLEFKFIPGSIEGIKKLNACGFKLYVISNQAGVSKGLYTQEDLDEINKNMSKELKAQGTGIEGIYYCTHLKSDNCDCRKPKTGLLRDAVLNLGANLEISFFIGDSFMDIEAARCFGAKSVLVLSGKEKMSNRDQWEFEPDHIFDNLKSAADYLCTCYG
ncbi:MAG: HAD family hydrolase [Candidatus Omnitrophica bacterium]|nr:HAD family hydrolase [Candidatus Omnitrophota bacterium]